MNWLQGAASFSVYARGLSDSWMILPTSFELPKRLSLTVLSRPPTTDLQPVQVLEFTATWVDQLAQSPPAWPSEVVKVDAVAFDGDRFSITCANGVIRFHIDKTKPIAVYTSEATLGSAQSPLTSDDLKLQNFPVASRYLAPDVAVDQMDIHKEGPPQQPLIRLDKYNVQPRLKALFSLVLGVLLMVTGFNFVASSVSSSLGGWYVVVKGSMLVAAGLLGFLFDR